MKVYDHLKLNPEMVTDCNDVSGTGAVNYDNLSKNKCKKCSN